MTVRIVQGTTNNLAEYAQVPIGFSVTEVFDDHAIAALVRGDPAAATPLASPYWKDYDEHPGGRPSEWANRFDVSSWTILAASIEGQLVGGAVLITAGQESCLLEGCSDCAVLWDLRVAPAARGRGVGAALLSAVEDVALRRGATALTVETQQINVPACRFYARHGFRLERATRNAYHDLPDEIQLLWRKALDRWRAVRRDGVAR